LIFIAVFLAGGILSSIYPAMILAAVNPIRALRGKNAVSLGNNHFRQGLTMFQFLISMLLIACTAVIYYQVEAMRKQSLSEDFEKVLVVHSPRTMIGHPERANFFREFRNYLENHSDIHSIASGGCLPGEDFLFHTENVVAEGKETAINWSFDVASIDEQYLPALGLKLIAGRNFEDRAGEEDKVILNETALGVLGFQGSDEAIQKFIGINNNQRYQVVGIMEDTHFRGLRESIKPLILKYGHDYEFGYFPIRIGTGDLHQTIRRIESGWMDTYPRDPFEYFFLDKFFDRQYSNDKAFGKIFGSFSLLAIFLSGLGLFGLISYTTAQKTREIGIRKVMGAGVLSIIKLLTVNMLKLLIAAAIIALPLAYWITGYWLNTFAYRFEPPFWMYLVPLVLLLFTSMVAVGGQTMKSALRNPVNAIAEE
jgi:putative ABC transport system permease protein